MTDDTQTHPTAARPPASALVAAVGASAGALDALRTLFGTMPEDCEAVFIVATHGSAERGTRLAGLLQPYTHLSVREAGAESLLEPNTVLVLPPTAEIAVIDTHVRLAKPPAGSSQRGRIDRVFRAVAAGCGERSAGIVLTGAGSDGALGLRQIKDRGGLALVQEPAEAECAGMPQSAIDTGVVDLVLPLREIAAALVRYAHPNGQPRPHDDGGAPLGELLELLQSSTGRDLSVYRRPVLLRHAAKRMRVRAAAGWPEYLALLRADAAEAEALANDVLLNVTEFFGDDKTYACLEADVLPRLLALKSGERDTLRAWVVGCSTGEHAYSLAIALLEQAARRAAGVRVQVFASEVGEALHHARAGFYPLEIEASMSPARLAKFFVREDGRGYRVRPELREVVVFASHDVVNDFPFSQLDLVVCSGNLLDDLNRDVCSAVLRNFHYALRPHGLLVVESSAGVEADVSQLFVADGKAGVYRRGAATRPAVALPRAAFSFRATRSPAAEARRSALDVRRIHLGALERHAPASVLVDADARILHYSARAGRFVRLPGGEPTHELGQLLREPLRSAVRVGLDAVDRSAAPWTSEPLLVHAESGVLRVAVHVEPVEPANTKVVVFKELAPGESVDDGRARDVGDFTALLESELDEASRRLRAVVAHGQESAGTDPAGGEQHDWALVSALADIESAKEELQIINEELLSLDRDNRARLEELGRLTADLEVLLESTGLATLFLDRDLNIVRFTPPLLEIFEARPSDKGRPLAELAHRLRGEDLVADARRVLKHLAPVEREVEADNGKWYLLRMLPYRSAPHGLGGVALTLVDVTSRKKAEIELREGDRRKDEFIALLAHELRNPLAPISSGIEILKRRGLEPAITERITATMSRQAAQLVRLIDDLLDVSRISRGRLRLRRGLVPLADIVRDAVAAVRPLIEQSGHELVIEGPREPVLLDADAARLTQVLANLLNNASRYTPNGGRIEVEAHRDGGHAVVTVRDNGCGIPAGTLPHVFEMFYQGSERRSATQPGLGIGLALAKSLVEKHGGTIGAASGGTDRGSEFTVRLPALEQAATADGGARGEDAPALGGHRVLVVDDNADAARTLAVLIETLGANDVHVALSGAEAIPLAARLQPDTVFLDLKMPDMDGFEVAQRLRRESWGPRVWLVALTGWGLDEHKRLTKDAGFDQHLTKPAERAALEAILSRPAAARV
jgi:two-component system CheB/CheR fusion protein